MNLLAVFAATIGSFIVGALWYSPILFIKPWCKETGVDPASSMTNPAKVYGLTFLLTLISAFALVFITGPAPELGLALKTALIISLAFIGSGMAINYQFAGNSLRHWLIDAGFHLSRFMVMGLILGLWR